MSDKKGHPHVLYYCDEFLVKRSTCKVKLKLPGAMPRANFDMFVAKQKIQ